MYSLRDLTKAAERMESPSENSLERLLAAFSGPDEPKAARAFEELSVLTRRGLNSYLRERLHSEEAREDVIQDVLRRIWTRRLQFENRGAAAWWSLVKLAAEQCRVDLVRKVGSEVTWDEAEVGEVPSDEMSSVDAVLQDLNDANELYRAADELWLGFDPSLSDAERARRTLAAHLFFNLNMEWHQVSDVLNRGKPSETVKRGQLDAWLANPATIRSLAFRTLYLDNAGLTACLLQLPSDEPSELQKVRMQAMTQNPTDNPSGNWTWTEIRVILWRYRDAERVDRILARESCVYDKQEIQAIFDRCLAEFPFPKIMERLCTSLTKWPKARQELTESGIWQRLVFEIYAKDTTQHRDIHDRTSPAASLAPYSLTPGMLNVWLSSGRMFAKLASYVQARMAK